MISASVGRSAACMAVPSWRRASRTSPTRRVASLPRPKSARSGLRGGGLIPNGGSLFINIGTTTEEVARALVSTRGAAGHHQQSQRGDAALPHPRIEVIVAGGSVRRADGAVVGEASNKLIQQFKVDFAVVGASAIDEDGALLDFDYREVQAAQAIIANARHVILVADSTKFRRTAPVRIGHISQVETFVTDRGLPAALRKVAQEGGIAVVEAMDRAAHAGPPRDYPQTAS